MHAIKRMEERWIGDGGWRGARKGLRVRRNSSPYPSSSLSLISSGGEGELLEGYDWMGGRITMTSFLLILELYLLISLR